MRRMFCPSESDRAIARPSRTAQSLLNRSVRFNRPSLEPTVSPPAISAGYDPVSFSFRWAVRDSAIQMFPRVSKRSFKWSYLLARTLRRLHPGSYL